MCGTSISQIEKTYYHTTEDKIVSNALADFEYKDGMLIPKKRWLSVVSKNHLVKSVST